MAPRRRVRVSKTEAQLGRNAYPWLPEHRTPPLSPILYSEAVVRCAQADVQNAPTRSDMIALSGVPAELWRGPIREKREVNPETGRPVRKQAVEMIPESEGKAFAARVLAVRAGGCSRGRLGELAGLGTGGKIWRIEKGKVQRDEVPQLESALRQVELELGIVSQS